MLYAEQEAAGKIAAETVRERLWWLPLALALVFALLSLRGASAGNVIDSDAARHAMNGAFLHDLIRDGAFLRPLEYAKAYYGRLPALSMPYHPPLFPLIEAGVFALFGVSVMSARVLIAFMVGLSAYLFYRLVLHTHRSHVLATASVTTFLLWQTCQIVASDVMLEFPTMVFITAALWFLRDLDQGLKRRDAAGFALLSVAAVWTKQHSVFLGAVPFVYYLFRLKPRLMFQKSLWAASAAYAAGVLAFVALSSPFKGSAAEHVAPAGYRVLTLQGNSLYYLSGIVEFIGLGPVVLAAIVVAAALVLPARGIQPLGDRAFYWAWALSSLAMLLIVGSFSLRYLFFVAAPVVVLVYDAVHRLAARVSSERAWLAPAVLAAVCGAIGLTVPSTFLRGPSEAAQLIMESKPRRILYCGDSDGNFIFNVRSIDSSLNTTVVPAVRFGVRELSPADFDQWLARYGIEYVVLEHSRNEQGFDALDRSPTSSMKLARRIPMASSHSRWNGGHLSVYKIESKGGVPAESINLPVPRIGEEIQVKF